MSTQLEEPVHILLVDDRAEDLMALSSVLGAPGYNLVTARSGQEALRQLLNQQFAVILLDVVMPTLDGFELARLIKQRERSRDTPIIFLTADVPDVSKIYRGYSVGAVDYLPKPVEPDVLRAKVGIFVELFRKDRRLQRQATALREAERRERDLQIAELKLAARRRYTNLAEAIPHIVWTAGPDGEFNYANRCWFEYTGLDVHSARGTGWTRVVHPDDVKACLKAWSAAVASGSVYEAECRIRRASDGAYRWHLARAVPETSDDGQVVAWLGTYTDFEELKQAIRSRDEFLSIASHELRTPLTALKLRLQGLLHGRDLEEKLQRKLEGAARQTERLERLIDNLLDVSRITTGHLDLEPEQLDLVEVLAEVIERFRGESDRGSSVELEADDSVSGQWDRLRIEQVATNLISNAMKYGEGRPVHVIVRGNDATAELTVRDQGIGILPEDLDRIFDQFERATGRRRLGGLGMGLFITREIVTAHGGSVRVNSTPGAGATFRVSLPCSSAGSLVRTTETTPSSVRATTP